MSIRKKSFENQRTFSTCKVFLLISYRLISKIAINENFQNGVAYFDYERFLQKVQNLPLRKRNLHKSQRICAKSQRISAKSQRNSAKSQRNSAKSQQNLSDSSDH